MFAARSELMKITATQPSTGSSSLRAKSNSARPGGRRTAFAMSQRSWRLCCSGVSRGCGGGLCGCQLMRGAAEYGGLDLAKIMEEEEAGRVLIQFFQSNSSARGIIGRQMKKGNTAITAASAFFTLQWPSAMIHKY
jgi:hypothetical protein